MTSPDSLIIRENVSLAPLTTLNVGGPARFFARARSENDIVHAFEYAAENRLDIFVLGGGSNILVSDRGFDGLVIQVALRGVTMSEPRRVGVAGGSDPIFLTAQAGEDWDPFVASCVERGLAGVECLSGIPGYVGGTPVQNVGAYGQEVAESIISVRCFDRTATEFIDLTNSDCGFTYRRSIFNSAERDRYVVLAVTYRLEPGGQPKIAYKDLQEYFGGRTPTLAETREGVLTIRRSKSMVIDPADPNSRSAGSFFKNPIIEGAKVEDLAGRAEVDVVPSFPAGVGKVKIPAAWLIERSGFHKGFRLGKAGISTKHSLAIVNRGGASAAEIVALKEKIQHDVEKTFDILLMPEPVLVGFDA